jgi:hypothetical protein
VEERKSEEEKVGNDTDKSTSHTASVVPPVDTNALGNPPEPIPTAPCAVTVSTAQLLDFISSDLSHWTHTSRASLGDSQALAERLYIISTTPTAVRQPPLLSASPRLNQASPPAPS